MDHTSQGELVYYSNSLLIRERRLTRWKILATNLSQICLHAGTTNETFQVFGNEDSFKDNESSGSQFFNTTTETESGAATLEKSMQL